MWWIVALACNGGPREGIQIGATTTGPPEWRGRVRILSGASAAAGVEQPLLDVFGTLEDPLWVESVLGDADGDGVDDLVIFHGSQARFLSGATIGQVEDPAGWPPVAAPGAFPVSVGDVTGDGVPDLVAGDGVYSGTDLSADAPAVAHLPVDGEVYFASARGAGDVNGDGVGDLLGRRVAPGSAEDGLTEPAQTLDAAVYFGPISGDLDPLLADASIAGDAQAAGDLDGDGRADLGLLWPDGDGDEPETEVALFRGVDLTPGSSLAPGDAAWTVTGETYVTRLFASGDLDADGRDEVWVGHSGDPAVLDVFSGADLDGRVFGASDRTFPFEQAVPPALGDFDGDGQADLALRPGGAYRPDPWEVRLYLGPALDGSSADVPDVVLTTDSAPVPMRIGDLDGDGADELVISEPNHP